MQRTAPTRCSAPRWCGGPAPPRPPPSGPTHRRALAARAQTSQALSADSVAELQRLLTTGSEDAAVALADSLRAAGSLRAFGTAQGVPKRSYTLEELRLNKIEASQFLSPEDTTLNRVRTALQASYVVGLSAAYLAQAIDFFQLVQTLVATAFVLTADQVASAGGLEALAVDSAGRLLSPTYARRVALHESGHFLIAYLLGLLPKGYALSSWDAFSAARVLNVQAGTTFCDGAFQKEVASGRLSSGSLDTYTCVALAGVATEWLRFGRAEGGLADIQQMDALLRALGFTQKKADDQVRWAVLNVVTLLRRHAEVQDALADAMARGAGVGECVAVVEAALAGCDDI